MAVPGLDMLGSVMPPLGLPPMPGYSSGEPTTWCPCQWSERGQGCKVSCILLLLPVPWTCSVFGFVREYAHASAEAILKLLSEGHAGVVVQLCQELPPLGRVWPGFAGLRGLSF